MSGSTGRGPGKTRQPAGPLEAIVRFHHRVLSFRATPFIALVLLVLHAAVIFQFSATSNPPGASAVSFPGGDKLAHMAEYGVFGVLLSTFLASASLTRSNRKVRTASWYIKWGLEMTILMGALYGASDEFHQMFTPGRTPDVVDWIVDCCGSTAGAIVSYWLVSSARMRRQIRQN